MRGPEFLRRFNYAHSGVNMAAASPVHLRMMLPNDPWTRAVDEVAVSEPGLTWESNASGEMAPQRFEAAATGGFDVGENMMRHIAVDIIAGKPANGVPVFLGREHFQRNIFVRANNKMKGLRDLVGKRVGSNLPVESGTGAGVLMMLEMAYGIDLHSIEWHCGRKAGLAANRMGLNLNRSPDNREELIEAVLRGDLDAGILNGGPRYWSLFGGSGDKLDDEVKQHPGIRLLLNHPVQIADTYKRSGLYPITDIVTVRPELAEQHPDLSDRLVSLFSKANALAGRYRPPDEQDLAEREIRILGEDPHQYGLTPSNRANLAALLDFFYRLGAIERVLDPEELFV